MKLSAATAIAIIGFVGDAPIDNRVTDVDAAKPHFKPSPSLHTSHPHHTLTSHPHPPRAVEGVAGPTSGRLEPPHHTPRPLPTGSFSIPTGPPSFSLSLPTGAPSFSFSLPSGTLPFSMPMAPTATPRGPNSRRADDADEASTLRPTPPSFTPGPRPTGPSGLPSFTPGPRPTGPSGLPSITPPAIPSFTGPTGPGFTPPTAPSMTVMAE